jgi:hypothetical protein
LRYVDGMTEAGARQPIVWVLLGERAGDNAQALALAKIAAEAAGAQVTPKPLAYNGLYRTPNIVLGASLRSLRAGRAGLGPPWPDMVIGVGRRSVPVAGWIKAQAGGSTKLVQIGRPRAPLHWFDLVVTTPQYRLPDSPNVLSLPLPPISSPTLENDEVERWREMFASLPRPWIGVLVGGARAPYRFDAAAARALASGADGLAVRLGGSLLVTTSPRTGFDQAHALAAALASPAYCNLWPGEDAAHQAVLALANRFIVTSDSVSMLAEACASCRPVAIWEPPRHRVYPAWSGERGIGRWLARAGLASPPRDPQAVVRRLIAGGHAALLGAAEPVPFVPVPDERPRIAAALRALLDGT